MLYYRTGTESKRLIRGWFTSRGAIKWRKIFRVYYFNEKYEENKVGNHFSYVKYEKCHWILGTGVESINTFPVDA